jgi:hypothetical protein
MSVSWMKPELDVDAVDEADADELALEVDDELPLDC